MAWVLFRRRAGAAADRGHGHEQGRDSQIDYGSAGTARSFRELANDKSRGLSIGRSRVHVRHLRTDVERCQGQRDHRPWEIFRGLEEAVGRELEVHCRYVELGLAGGAGSSPQDEAPCGEAFPEEKAPCELIALLPWWLRRVLRLR